MTQIEREDLVERYLSGGMTPSQESEFFLHVAVDDELQRTLKAFRIMDRAIASEREAVIAERSPYRDHIMALLAVSPAMTADGAAGAASTTAPVTGGTIAGLGVWKTVLIAVVAGGVAAGTAVVVLPKIMGSDDAPPAVRTVSPGDLRPMEEPSVREEQVSESPLPKQQVETSEESRQERNGNARTSLGIRKSRQGAEEGAEKAGTTSTGQPTDPKADPYVKLPAKSPDEVKIPTEISRPKPENP